MCKFKKLYIISLIFIMCFCKNVYAENLNDDEYSYDNLFYNKNNLEVSVEVVKEPIINSRAAVVIDRKTGRVLYEKNCNEIRKMASTTKIMTAIVVLENTSNLYQTVTVSKKAAAVGGSVLGLKTNEKITINDLLYGLMLKSGNDAAIVLAESVGGSVEGFATLMNNKAEELCLENTHFVTPHGLDNEEHFTTAYELAKLANYALENKKFKEIVGTKNYTITISGKSVNISNGNELLGNFDGVYGVKTGFTNGANRCLVSACKRNGIDIISVVLGADTKNIRTADSKKILEYTLKNTEYVDIENKITGYFQEWNNDNFIEIEKGKEKYTNIKIENIKYSEILLNKNKIDKVKIKIECDTFLEAPIYKNSKIGEIIVKIEDEEILKSNIVIENTVERKKVQDYFFEIISNFKKYMLENFV